MEAIMLVEIFMLRSETAIRQNLGGLFNSSADGRFVPIKLPISGIYNRNPRAV